MNTLEFLSQLRSRDIQLSVNNGKLRLKAPPGALTPELKAELTTRKAEILALLANTDPIDAILPIEPAPRGKSIPLSIAQQHLWSLMQLEPNTAAYTMYQVYRLQGRLNLDAFERSLNEIVCRHETLRTVYQLLDGEPRQVIQSPETFKLSSTDISSMDTAEQEDYIKRYATAEIHRPFDLARGPLLSVELLRLSADTHTFLLIMHHSISDGWSFRVFLDEFQTLYSSYCDGREPMLPTVPVQYADFAIWQQQWLESELYQRQRRYWQQQLAEAIAAPELPLDNPRPSAPTSRGGYVSLAFPAELTAQIKARSAQEQATLFTTLLAAFTGVLHLYSKQETFIICSPVACRNQPELQQAIGYFNNTVLMNIDLSNDPTIQTLIGRLKQVVQQAFENQEFPFKQVAELPGMARIPLSRAMFVLQDAPEQWFALPGLQIEPMDIEANAVQYDLALTLQESDGQLTGYVGYKTELFEEATIAALIEHFQQILEIFVAAPEKNLSSLPRSRVLCARSAPHSEPVFDLQQRSAYTAPRTPLERQLTDIWESVLERSPIGVQDNFFELGGHSLLALRLFTRIEQEVGMNLPLATLFKGTTIESLATIIEQPSDSSDWATLVEIQPKGSKTPFFCIHGITGDILWFRELGQCLASSDQPFYGLQSRGLDGAATPFEDIESMAAFYIEEIRRVQPRGPYSFGGASLGGTIALEMAQQLTAQGEVVKALVMFDHAPELAGEPEAGLRGQLQKNLATCQQLSLLVRRVYGVGRGPDQVKSTA